MPDILLPVPQRNQSYEATCLPAAVQMVLAYLGNEMAEHSLIDLLGADVTAGTPFPNVTRLKRIGYQIEYSQLSDEDIRIRLDRRHPVITPLWTQMLTYWAYATAHVAVVVGYDDKYVYLNDPAFEEAPQRVLWDGFLAAWEEYDRMAAVIHPKQ